jgi:multisubunit Na+/H+ antiporter MnhB subunit
MMTMSIVELIAGYGIYKSAKHFFGEESQRARRTASAATIWALLGLLAAAVASSQSVGTFFILSYFVNASNLPFWGFLLTAGGAWFCYWALNRQPS